MPFLATFFVFRVHNAVVKFRGGGNNHQGRHGAGRIRHHHPQGHEHNTETAHLAPSVDQEAAKKSAKLLNPTGEDRVLEIAEQVEPGDGGSSG